MADEGAKKVMSQHRRKKHVFECYQAAYSASPLLPFNVLSLATVQNHVATNRPIYGETRAKRYDIQAAVDVQPIGSLRKDSTAYGEWRWRGVSQAIVKYVQCGRSRKGN